MAAAMLSRSGVRVFASAAKDNTNKKPAARVVPKASLNDAPKMFKETGAEAPMPTASLNFTSTPFDNYKFAPIREATVSVPLLLLSLLLALAVATAHRKRCLLYSLPGTVCCRARSATPAHAPSQSPACWRQLPN